MTFPQLDRPYAVDVTLPNDRGEEFSTSFALASQSEVHMRLSDTVFSISSRDPAFTHTRTARRRCPAKEEMGQWVIHADHDLRQGLAAVRGPSYPLLSHADIKRTNAQAHVLVTAQDPLNDDTGIGTVKSGLHFSYPANRRLRSRVIRHRRLLGVVRRQPHVFHAEIQGPFRSGMAS